MQRYNMFHQIHKGLRALLYETALQVQHTDFWNVDETQDVIENIKNIISMFESHAHHEDRYVFSAVEKYEPAIADAFEQEHVKDHELGLLISQALDKYESAAVITEKAEAAKEVQTAFVKFIAFNLDHMAKEEDIINKVLWRYYSDAELMAISGQIVADIAPHHIRFANKWMMRGLNNPEISSWLKMVEKNAPEPVFQSLFGIAEKELPEKRFRQVLEGMTEGVMLA